MDQDWKAVINFLCRYKWLYIGALVVSILISVTIWQASARLYRATVLMAPVTNNENQMLAGISGQLTGLAGIVGINPQSNNRTTEALAMLSSRVFVTGFIDENNLRKDIMFRYGLGDVTENGLYQIFVEEILSVHIDTTTGLVSVGVTWFDPEVSALWANSLVRRLNDVMREQVIHEAEESIRYLYAEIEKSPLKDVQQSIFVLIESQINRATLARARSDFAVKIIDPAVAPDIDDPARPRPIMLLSLGLFCGFCLATFVGIMMAVLSAASTNSEAG